MNHRPDTPTHTTSPEIADTDTTDPTPTRRRCRRTLVAALVATIAIAGIAATTDTDENIAEVAFGSTWS